LRKALDIIVSDLIELFRPYLKDINSVLDIGTGTSIPIHVFFEKFPEIEFFTVDIVDIRKKKTLPFLIFDGNKLPFGNLEFDVSILNETLHHCEEPLSVLTEARRVAKYVYVIEHFPNQDTEVSEIINTEMSALRNFGMNCNIYKPFNESSLFSLFENAGLKVDDKIEIPYYGEREIKKYFFKLI
jgi:ubiquinone/menaquinone biosynthesis C-methylase UbiE